MAATINISLGDRSGRHLFVDGLTGEELAEVVAIWVRHEEAADRTVEEGREE